jgi:hypothetical protein
MHRTQEGQKYGRPSGIELGPEDLVCRGGETNLTVKEF